MRPEEKFHTCCLPCFREFLIPLRCFPVFQFGDRRSCEDQSVVYQLKPGLGFVRTDVGTVILHIVFRDHKNYPANRGATAPAVECQEFLVSSIPSMGEVIDVVGGQLCSQKVDKHFIEVDFVTPGERITEEYYRRLPCQ